MNFLSYLAGTSESTKVQKFDVLAKNSISGADFDLKNSPACLLGNLNCLLVDLNLAKLSTG